MKYGHQEIDRGEKRERTREQLAADVAAWKKKGNRIKQLKPAGESPPPPYARAFGRIG